MTMSRSDTGPNQDGPNDGRTDAEILDGDRRDHLDDDHVPVPAAHTPRLQAEQPHPDSNRLRVSERNREDAWIEYEPVGGAVMPCEQCGTSNVSGRCAECRMIDRVEAEQEWRTNEQSVRGDD